MDGNESSVHEFWRSTEVYGEVFGMAMNYTMDAGVMDQLYWGASTIEYVINNILTEIHTKRDKFTVTMQLHIQ